MKAIWSFILSILLLMIGCTNKEHNVKFVIHDCVIEYNVQGRRDVTTESFSNIRLFKNANGRGVNSQEDKFITVLNQGENNLMLEEGHYYVASDRRFRSSIPISNFEDFMIKEFNIKGVILEYDLCNIYDMGDWRSP